MPEAEEEGGGSPHGAGRERGHIIEPGCVHMGDGARRKGEASKSKQGTGLKLARRRPGREALSTAIMKPSRRPDATSRTAMRANEEGGEGWWGWGRGYVRRSSDWSNLDMDG